VNNVIFENGEGENICFAKYPALCKRGLSLVCVTAILSHSILFLPCPGSLDFLPVSWISTSASALYSVYVWIVSLCMNVASSDFDCELPL